ncbi:MAG: protein-L-isoaspartate(D-aspartate) O-methyltransferase [Saprospiraceae bacterium]|nr:protein-L-isoaspartate(D-aspartate) O-methyltransferase [Saprospiraceae bacterium]
MIFEDNYRQKGLRRKLVEQLRKKGIHDVNVLNAINTVPRHLFLDTAFEEWAYKDNAFPIDCEQTISQPYTVAFQTQLLEVKEGDKILEIGLGSGYQACVLYELKAKVYSIERHKTLHDKTSTRLKTIGYSAIRTFYGDGYLGLPRQAPFDKILITASVKETPTTLLAQLKINGLMVYPHGDHKDTQIMTRIIKRNENDFQQEAFGQFRFVPMLKGKE